MVTLVKQQYSAYYNYILDEEDEDENADIPQQSEGKVGAKKLKKLQEKAEKKAMREVNCSPVNIETIFLNFVYFICACVLISSWNLLRYLGF